MCSVEQDGAPDLDCGARLSSAHAGLEELEREICELAAHLAAATCRWLLLVAAFDQRRGWAEWGAKSCAEWLSWRCSIGRVTAREHVRVARRLVELPHVREAFAAGELTYCKVRAITRVASPETEVDLVELARHASGAQVEKLVRLYHGALRASADAAQRASEQRSLSHYCNDDGSITLQARLPAEDGALVLRALEALERRPEARGASAEALGQDEGPAARRADALVAMAHAALANADAAGVECSPCELVVHVDVVSLGGDRVHERCQIADGATIAPETARRLGCDASVVRIIERDGRPLSVSRRKRTIPAALRRALRSRDAGCQFPGCTSERFLHAHHIQHWARGGPTVLENLIQLCSHHHRLVHEGGFCVERAGPRGVRFRRPDGREIPPCPPASSGRDAAVREDNRARGLLIDGNTCRPRSLGDPLDYDIAVEGLCVRAQLTLPRAGPAPPRAGPAPP